MPDLTQGFEGALLRRMRSGSADSFDVVLARQMADRILGQPAAGTISSPARPDPFDAFPDAPIAARANGIPAKRLISFEGRTIQVPGDATDAEIAEILDKPPAAPAEAANPFDRFDAAAPARNPFDQFDAFPDAPTASAQAPAPQPRGPQMTPEEADFAVSGLRPQPAATPARAPLQGDSAAGIAKAGAQGAVQGLDMLLDAPVHAVNQAPRLLNMNAMLVNKIMGRDVIPYAGAISDDPLLPSDIIHAPDRALGARQYEPQGPVERIANRAGQELGASAVPTVGALYAGGRLGLQGARALGLSQNTGAQLAAPMVEAAAANPSGLVGREAAGATAAGLGAGTANEVARAALGGDHHPIADLFGSIGGVSTLAVAKPVFGAVKSLAGAAYGSSAFADDVAREAVANELIAHSANAQRQVASGVDRGSIDAQPLANAMRQPSAAEELIPGYRSDVADRTGDPGLASYVFGHTAANPGLDTVRRAENQAAVADRMSDLAPQGSAGQFRADLQGGVDTRIAQADTAAQDAEARTQRLIEAIMPRQTPQARGATVRSAVDDALGRFVSDVQERHAAAIRAADEAAGRLMPQTDPAVRGDVVRGALETARGEARQRTSAAYDAAAIDGRTADITPLASQIDDALGSMTAVERGLVPQGLVDRVTALGRPAADGTPAAPARLKEVTDLRSELDRAQRNALADPRAENGGRNAARVIGQLQDRVEGFISSALSPEERAALETARGAKRAEADSFTRSGDTVAAVLGRRPGGQPNLRDERVAGSFVNPATEQPLQRLFAEADTPAVRGAIRDEIASRIGADARTDPARLDRFLADYEIPLRQFPGLRDEIAGAATARRGATEAEAAVGARRQEFSGDSRALSDTAARRSDGTPALLDEQIPGRFVNPAGNRDLDALFARADTPAVRGALEDHILGSVQGAVDRPAALRQQVASLREPLSRFPGLEERLLAAADGSESSAAARGTADATRRDLTTPGRSAESSYLKYDTNRTVDSMRTVLSNPQPEAAARQLVAAAGGDPEHARAAFWEVLKQESTTNGGVGASGRQETSGLRGHNFLSDPKHDAVARVLYQAQPQQLQDIKDVFSALAGGGSATRAKRPGSSGTPQGMKADYDSALSASSIASRIRSVNRGQLSPAIAGIDLIATYLRRKSAQIQSSSISKLRDEVIQNPEMAARLLEDYNPATFAAKRRELQSAYGARGSEAVKLLDEAHDEEQRPVAAAVRAGAR